MAFLLLLMLVDPSTNAIRRALFYGAIFFFGTALRPWLDRLRQAPIWVALPLGVFGLIVGLASAMGAIGIGPARPWTAFLVLPGVLFVIWVWSRIPRLTAAEFIGRHSMVLYCVHFPIQILIADGLAALGVTATAPVLLSCLIGGIGVPLVLMIWYDKARILFEIPAPTRSAIAPQGV